jgi:hypothetical protein
LFDLSTGKFEKATSASLSINLGNGGVNLSGYRGLQGRFLYSIAGRDYLGQPATGEHTQKVSGVIVSGIVKDTQGEPVAGAALKIGAIVVYSDSTGSFQARIKNARPVPFEVLIPDFLTGSWRLVSSPVLAEPSKPLEVVVSRM